jgi:hypothetical protein
VFGDQCTRRQAWLAVFASLCACERVNSSAEETVQVGEAGESTHVLVGVNPQDFDCESVAPEGEVKIALGMAVQRTDPHFVPPAGVPAPCDYVGPSPEQLTFSFDLDCRTGARDTGGRLMAEYATDPTSQPVMVGRSGIDHRDAVLLFVDDDSPCYGRVMGPGAGRRLALARVVAGRLRESNAPSKVEIRSAR